jgi:hypothetical protein
MGFMQPSEERRTSGVIFDYLVLFVLQKFAGVPVIGPVRLWKIFYN